MQPSPTVKNLIPSQSMSLDQHNLGHVPPQPQPSPRLSVTEPGTRAFGSSNWKPEQDFSCDRSCSPTAIRSFMISTTCTRPTFASLFVAYEKHIWSIKRHYVHTAVQTGNFELREVSRYQVALKVSRTSRGVPLLEDIPLVGVVFRPSPSDESSLQQNIIFGQTNVFI